MFIAPLLLATSETRAKDSDAKPRAVKAVATPGASEAAAVGPGASKSERERAAKRACLTGDPDGGVALLTDLYIDTNDPTYLFNQGRCFEQNRRYEDAIGRFREYLVKAKGLRAEDRAETEQHIALCTSYLRGTETTTPEVRTTTKDSDAAPPPPHPEHTTTVVKASERPGRAGAGLRTAGLVIGAVGVAGLVTGVVLNLKANGLSADLEREYDPDVNSTRTSYKTGAWIGYGAGAACLAGAVALYSLGWWRDRQANGLTLAPAVGSDLAGVIVRGAF